MISKLKASLWDDSEFSSDLNKSVCIAQFCSVSTSFTLKVRLFYAFFSLYVYRIYLAQPSSHLKQTVIFWGKNPIELQEPEPLVVLASHKHSRLERVLHV